MTQIRIGVIGLGNIGLYHAEYLAKGEVKGAILSAVCDVRVEHARTWAQSHGPVQAFDSAEALIDSDACDAILIATPPFQHAPLAIRAFGRGLHVLTEKPAGPSTLAVREMNQAAIASGRVFGIMFFHRLFPAYLKAHELIVAGELGQILRTQWTSTQWFRTQDYYDSGGWRGTWAGEGGGVLLNQCPHDLDLWQWLCGLPTRVRAFCHLGKWHDIEVEDEVTAYAEYANGATGVFICSTGEAPGANRLEIVGDRGTLVITDDRKLELTRMGESVRQFCREHKGGFGFPQATHTQVSLPDEVATIRDNTQEFVNATLTGAPLTAPGIEGIRSLELSNAMQLSTWTNDFAPLPIDDMLYNNMLQEKIRTSKVRKPQETRTFDVSTSWRR